MQVLKLAPVIHYFDTVKEWNETFPINNDVLVVTNEWLYKPYLEPLGITCNVIFQEKYGMGEPNDEMIDSIVRDAKDFQYDTIVAFGGGTIIDICKILALDVPAKSEDLFMGKVPPRKVKKLVAVPTTCGTGSEVTNVAIAELKNLGVKRGIAVEETYADKAVLIPESLKGLPYKVFVTSSVDALIHAIESYLSPKASDFTDAYAQEAIMNIMNGYKDIIKRGEDARFDHLKEFMMASTFAGISFGNAGCGAVHALAYSIGATFHVPHGEANYQFFPSVMKYYAKKNPEGKLRSLSAILADALGVDPTDVVKVYEELDAFLSQLIARKPLREYGMTVAQIDEFAKMTFDNQQRLLSNNYAPTDEDDLRTIFEELY